mmetsp:Transcript_92211/g.192817  ORF Transcript_92211/g.192817 Transcript_92211/m.192817 type:complete len:117 (+) Transcript_92211:274-624(+)|eukprot:CAMPEP_0206472330 /NCGR_PEP_ID=MMETSP0324_2-20121206/32127_1 /ASSEMBLY_ACC=CAM_ASM_000836 /TAXON_ID=2866 /ORGANISM="Crypthecodinium cohnii, Strain Seligo" /LENGTH=116 /DNA_ID=CAMNT_0053946891 /DNA_START=200 /DNA_END=550 /DNA_ORIENTATION=+
MSEEWRLAGQSVPAGGYKWRADEYYNRPRNKDVHMLSPDWFKRSVENHRTTLHNRMLGSSTSSSGGNSLNSSLNSPSAAQNLVGRPSSTGSGGAGRLSRSSSLGSMGKLAIQNRIM